MPVKLSVTSKLDGIPSWSLTAVDDCPGSAASDGELVPACQGCYARDGNYRFANVRAPRLHNREDWQREDWVDDMVAALAGKPYFRWFDSGDMYALPLARKIYHVMRRTPDCKHWLPTRMQKFAKFQAVLRQMEKLQNVAVRFSSDSITGAFLPGIHGSTIVPTNKAMPGVHICQAYEHGGKCSGCRVCWDRQVPVVGYVAHGRRMVKLVNITINSA